MKSFSLGRLTKRERLLVIGLGLIAFIFIYMNYVVTPLIVKFSDSKMQADTLVQQVDSLKNAGKNLPLLKEEMSHNRFKIAFQSARFFPEIVQEKFIVMMDDLAVKSGASLQTVSFTKPVLAPMDTPAVVTSAQTGGDVFGDLAAKYKGSTPYKDNANKAVPAVAVPATIPIWKMDMNVSFQGNYATLLSFMDAVEQMNKAFYIKQLSMSSDPTTGNLTGSMQMTVYAIAKLDNDAGFYTWNYTDKYGRIDPFTPYSGFSGGSVGSIATVNSFSRDLFVSVNPVSSDLPTVVVGKGRDSQGSSYLYGDNSGTEKLTMEIAGKAGDYTCRYTLAGKSYPANGFDKLDVTGKTVGLSVISSSRVGVSDNSGISLTVKNSSDLTVNVKVEYDDLKKPRVKIAGKSGNVNIVG